MCGRYAVAPGVDEAWAPVQEVLGAEVEAALDALAPRYNIAPTTQVPIVYQTRAEPQIRVELARWGFVPHWWRQSQPPQFAINARCEDAAAKPMWRDAWRGQRCLVPATHWYEWQEGPAGKRPYAHQVADGLGFMLAGLWSLWRPAQDADPIMTCAIVTRDAPAPVSDVHPRMPVILRPEAWLRWIDPHRVDAAAASALLAEHAVLDVKMWEVSRAVNRAANDGPDLLLPIPVY